MVSWDRKRFHHFRGASLMLFSIANLELASPPDESHEKAPPIEETPCTYKDPNSHKRPQSQGSPKQRAPINPCNLLAFAKTGTFGPINPYEDLDRGFSSALLGADRPSW